MTDKTPKNAGEGKSDEGESSNQTQNVGTTIGFSDANFQRIEGQPSLIRSRINSKGKSVTMDMWASVINGLDSSQLTKILMVAQSDTSYDMTQFIRNIEYQGFDRLFYIKHALSKMSVSVFCRFAIIGALRGSNFRKISETCEQMPEDLTAAFTSLNIMKTPKKRTDLTILRSTASIPHWCAFWSLKAGIEKKIPADSCPASLQFPGAASLPMSQEVRRQHIKFCIDFSTLLPGGQFNFNIYMTAMNNTIPVTDIPQEVLTLLSVSSTTESYKLTEEEVVEYGQTKALIKR